MATERHVPVSRETPAVPPPGVSYGYNEGGLWSGRAQWGAIFAGALAGFATFLIMTTLGAAIGVSAGAGFAGTPVEGEEAERAALGFGLGAVLWIFLTAVATGLVGGLVLSRTARTDRPYMPWLFGGLTWAAGVMIALVLAVPGAGGMIGGLSGAAAQPDALEPFRDGMRDGDRGLPPLTDEEKAKAAIAAAWVLLGSQLVSLAATMLAAQWHKSRRAHTEIHVHPSPTV